MDNAADFFSEFLSDSDSDCDFESDMFFYACASSMVSEPEGNRVGSRLGKRPNIDRRAEEGAARLYDDYFSDRPLYTDKQFRRRFRMRRALFLRIQKAVEQRNEYFVQRPDATGKMGLTSLQKCTAAMRQLAYGSPSDAVDEYVRIGESTARKCLTEFCRTVDEVFGEEYLRSPTRADLDRLLREGDNRGFPGMLGSLDCCHWQWKNCPTAWAGQYKGKEKKPTIILEAVASYDLWIWHAFFGMPGSNNDITVLHRSPLFSDLYNGKAPEVQFTINGRDYTKGYYLADGIYPRLSTLVQTISAPIGQKRKYFAKQQEAARKDIERTFGVLLSQFAILKNPARMWSKEDLRTIMRACIILHNMIVEDQRDNPIPPGEKEENEEEDKEDEQDEQENLEVENEVPFNDFAAFLQRYQEVHNSNLHDQLQNDLVEHLWFKKGEQE